MESALKSDSRVSWPLSRRAPVNLLLALARAKRAWYRITHWETWDWRVKYILIAPVWCWWCLRARSPWFFTASNPTLTFGGFDGESKREIYAQLPPGSFPNSLYASHAIPFRSVEELLIPSGFRFPIAVKPDVGKMGFMFRRINSSEELRQYHARVGCDYIIQDFVTYPIEVSVFYYRFPGAQSGTITGFIRKEFLQVTGDGKSTLLELMLQYPRVQFRLEEMKAKHKSSLHHVLDPGATYCLSPALNLSRGGKLVSLEHEKDSRLLKVFDDLSHYTGSFYYGRYDIRCRSIEDLKAGRHFSILEYNGSGAEPHHVYGNGYSLWQACGILAAHWKVLFEISRINNAKGIPYWNYRRGRKFLQQTAKHLGKLRQLDAATPVT